MAAHTPSYTLESMIKEYDISGNMEKDENSFQSAIGLALYFAVFFKP